MNHIEALRAKGYTVTLKKHSVGITPKPDPALAAKIKAASSLIVRELIEESDPPLIRAIRDRRVAICQKCGEDTELIPYPGEPDWRWYDCMCRDCRAVHVTNARVIQDAVLLNGSVVIDSTTLGDRVTITADDSVPGDYTLQELLRIDPANLQTIHNAKRAFPGSMVVTA